MAQVEPLVMLPPMMSDARVFLPQLAEFSRERTVIVSPVHSAERIEEIASSLLDGLPQRFALVGMGFGGSVALELVRRAAKRVTRLALIGTSPLEETPQAASEREPRMIAAKMGRLDDAMADELPSENLFDGPRRATITATLREMGRALGPEAYVRQARASQRRKDQTAILRSVDQPVLIMSGEVDPHLPPRRHEFLAELVERAEFRVIAEAGVLPTLEQPVAVLDALRDWLGSPLALR